MTYYLAMNSHYIPRRITQEFKTLLQEYPVVTILGPRQAGKTTLAREVLPDYQYINLENPEDRELAELDPKTFLSGLRPRVILDEIQRVPKLLSYIQVIVDEAQHNATTVMGRFILTGSHQLELNQQISQSLAGRTAILTLLPLSMEELCSMEALRAIQDPAADNYQGLEAFARLAIKGFMPRVFSQNIRPHTAYSNYYRTYVERDVRQLINLKDLSLFEKFLKLLAGRVGQPLNLTSLGNDVGASQKTIKQWLSILEASFIIFKLPPYFENFGKRVLKSPKYYFIEIGLLLYLLGIESPEQLKRDPLLGSIFENLVIIEISKALLNRGKSADLYFFRDHAGLEVDLIISGRVLKLIEIKAAATYNASFLKGLTRLRDITDSPTNSGTDSYIVYSGEDKAVNDWVALRNFGRCYELI